MTVEESVGFCGRKSSLCSCLYVFRNVIDAKLFVFLMYIVPSSSLLSTSSSRSSPSARITSTCSGGIGGPPMRGENRRNNCTLPSEPCSWFASDEQKMDVSSLAYLSWKELPRRLPHCNALLEATRVAMSFSNRRVAMPILTCSSYVRLVLRAWHSLLEGWRERESCSSYFSLSERRTMVGRNQ